MKKAIRQCIVQPVFTLFFTTIIFCAGCKPTQQTEGITRHESTEWSHTWIVNSNDAVLPKVLLVGDSHVERYYSHVKNKLGDKVSVSRFTSSRCLGDPLYLDQLEIALKQQVFDVVCFNNGLHGREYPETEYGRDIPEMYRLLQKHKVKNIVFVNTTPVRKIDELQQLDKSFNTKVIERNRLIGEFANKNNIPLVDLYKLGINDLNLYSNDGIHFNDEGVRQEAMTVTKAIESLLIR